MTVQQDLSNPIVERAVKTFIETGAAQLALTTQISTSSVEKLVASAAAAALSVLWNGAQAWLATHKASKAAAFETAVAAAVAKRPDVPPQAGTPQTAA